MLLTKKYSLSKESITYLWNYLGFDICCLCEMRVIDLKNKKVIYKGIYYELETLINDLENYNGKGNCFIGRNPRTEENYLDSDNETKVKFISCISLDLDPKDYDKLKGATNEQTEKCISAAKYILDKFPNGQLAFTGNGALLLWVIKGSFRESCKLYEDKIKAFQDFCRELIKDKFPEVIIDATQDSARLIKLIGTVSVKGEDRNTRWLLPIQSKQYPNGENVFKFVDMLRDRTTYDKATLLAKSAYKSRSEADYAFARFCKESGLNEEECLTLIKTNPLGRNDRIDDHKRIVEKVYKGNNVDINFNVYHLGDKPTIEKTKTLMENKLNNTTNDLPTGIDSLDKVTNGLKNGEIYTIAGRPGVGKTTYLLNMALKLSKSGKKVLFLSTEMSYTDLLQRLLTIETGRPLDASTFKETMNSLDKFENLSFYMVDSIVPNPTQVGNLISDFCPDVFFFDHIQDIEGGEEWKNLSLFVQKLKQIAINYNCAFVIASQLKRPMQMMDFKSGQTITAKPSMSDLKACGKMEEKSAFVLLLYPETQIDANTEIIVADLCKNRFGPKALSFLKFDKLSLRFYE